MSPTSSPDYPFHFSGPVDPRYFVGRRAELDFITDRVVGDQPTSINIIGPRRIGKTCLLYHFYQTYEQRVQNRGKDPRNYVAVYLSLEGVHCQSEEKFYNAIAEAFQKRPVVQNRPELMAAFQGRKLDRVGFSEALYEWKSHGEKQSNGVLPGVLPILCLDKFECLMRRRKQFDNDFYNNLRSLMENNALMLVIASYWHLNVYSTLHRLTSSFFNVGHVLPLAELTNEEAGNLVQLPDVNHPALSDRDRELALKWGENHPALLQLAAISLFDAQRYRKSEKWAKEQFLLQSRVVPRLYRWQKMGRDASTVGGFLFGLPLRVVQWAVKIGNWIGLAIAFSIGATLIVAIVLAISGQLDPSEVLNLCREFWCSTFAGVMPEWCPD